MTAKELKVIALLATKTTSGQIEWRYNPPNYGCFVGKMEIVIVEATKPSLTMSQRGLGTPYLTITTTTTNEIMALLTLVKARLLSSGDKSLDEAIKILEQL